MVIVGQTGSGKSQFALRLAKSIKGEIISFDAIQLYKGLPVLTNQPSLKDQKRIRHHFVGFLPLHKEFSAAQFAQDAKKVIQDILHRKKVPILVGGSGFYLKALLEGKHAPIKAQPALRKKYLKLIKGNGSASLHKRLRAIDPKRAREIHPNDAYRLMRALEIYDVTGKRPSTFGKEGGLEEVFDIQKKGLRVSRKALYQRIDRRVEEMIQGGALQEVKRTLRKRLSPTAKKIIGLEELASYLKGKSSLEEAISKMQQATRNYAKRQATWFRREKGVHWQSEG